MENLQLKIEEQLDSLRNITCSDFSALACFDHRKNRIQWKYVSGNLNNRYKQMVKRLGHGLSGLVVRFGRHIIIDGTDPAIHRKRLEYPIMLSENLHSALAVPVTLKGNIRGVLLIGSRTIRVYTEKEMKLTYNASKEIALLLIKETT